MPTPQENLDIFYLKVLLSIYADSACKNKLHLSISTMVNLTFLRLERLLAYTSFIYKIFKDYYNGSYAY